MEDRNEHVLKAGIQTLMNSSQCSHKVQHNVRSKFDTYK